MDQLHPAEIVRHALRTGVVSRGAVLMPLAAPEPSYAGFLHSRAADVEAETALGQVITLTEEAERRLANLVQLVSCNLQREACTGVGAATPTLDSMLKQLSAAIRLQELLDGADTAAISVADHLRALGNALDRLVLRPRGHTLTVAVDASAAELRLPAAAVRTLSRLVVEAVMNAAKHAFPTGAGGQVTLRLGLGDAGLSCLVADNGVGNHGMVRRADSRGMILTSAMARQAGGCCGWVFGSDGTEVRITWPVELIREEVP